MSTGIVRTLYGIKIPEGAVSVEIRSAVAGAGRPRLIYKGPLEEGGVWITEDTIADTLSIDEKFWEWVTSQTRVGRIVAEKSLIRLKLTLSFTNQDGSVAILDPVLDLKTQTTDEVIEFYKGKGTDREDAITALNQLNHAIISQQKEIPVQMANMLSTVVENGQKAISAASASSAAILTASIEPLSKAMALLEKAYAHESMRADKATDAVLRMLNNQKQETSAIDEATKLMTLAGGFFALLEKGKKVVN